MFRSPLLALVLALLAFAGAASSSLAAASPSLARWLGRCGSVLLWYSAWRAWQWWSSLEVLIDGEVYKENASKPRPRVVAAASASAGSKHRAGVGFKPVDQDGFCTPPDSEAGASPAARGGGAAVAFGATPPTAIFAPFAPSLPYGDQPGPPSLSSPLVPYWLECDASVFDVRNIRYKTTREKVSSDFAVYDCVGMDMIRDRRRIESVLDRLPPGAGAAAPAAAAGGEAAVGGAEAPASAPPLPRSPADAPPWSASWGVPRVLVVNCQLPYKAGWIMGAHPEDDGGLSVVNYFVLSKKASELLAVGQATPALGLWRRFVAEGASTKEGISFKVVGRVEDLEKYEVPESFHRFNNKPVLLTKSSRVTTGGLPEVIEISYDVRTWVYPARTALANYHHRAKEAELEIGYLVEGKTDDELPEQILGCFKLHNMDITQAQWVSIM